MLEFPNPSQQIVNNIIQGRRGTKRAEDCVFPFRFKGKEYGACTAEHDPEERHWCAVEVDENGDSEGRLWGHCDHQARCNY